MMYTDRDETQPAGNHFTRMVTAVLYSFVFTMALGVNGGLHAQTVSTHYAQMAPVAEYLDTNVGAETALARSAAPAAISRDATVLVLKSSGYETAQKGKNGFVCLVERAWMGPMDGAEFWNPKVRGAVCFNPPRRAVRFADHFQENRVRLGWLDEGSNQCPAHRGGNAQGTPGARGRIDVLHDGERQLLGRCRGTLASASHVLWQPIRRVGVGRRCRTLARFLEPPVSGCPRAFDDLYRGSTKLV